jgi:hypothetical protein
MYSSAITLSKCTSFKVLVQVPMWEVSLILHSTYCILFCLFPASTDTNNHNLRMLEYFYDVLPALLGCVFQCCYVAVGSFSLTLRQIDSPRQDCVLITLSKETRNWHCAPGLRVDYFVTDAELALCGSLPARKHQ